MNRPHSTGFASILLLAAAFWIGGCETIQDFFKTDENRIFGADLMVRKPSRPRVDFIKQTISVADVRTNTPPNATPPTEEDAKYREEDYVIGTTDIVDISVMDLFAVGAEALLRREVSDAGYIDMPLLQSRIKALGLTQEQLKNAIINAYKNAAVLRDPVVSVSVVARRQNTFTMIGAIDRRGTYNILRKDMRMLEALGLGGDVTSYTVKYIYVFRPPPAIISDRDANLTAESAGAPALAPGTPEQLGPLPTPVSPSEIPTPSSTSAPSTQKELDDLQKLLPGTGKIAPAGEPASRSGATSVGPRLSQVGGPASGSSDAGDEVPAPSGGGRWIYSNGKWVREGAGAAPSPSPSPNGAASRRSTLPALDANVSPFDLWRSMQKAEGGRVIAINYQSLMNGDWKSNIVIRDNDVIYVPREEVGEFYIMGEVARPGVYSLTGRQITVKMAVAAAGNISQTGWPENSILIRRIGDQQEQVIPLNIEAIFHGRASDLFLKPDDVIAVGSNWRQPFWAIFRNAFRYSYGFGFVYDRNFADPAAGQGVLNAKRFTRW